MDVNEAREQLKRNGVEAGKEARRETIEACKQRGATPIHVIDRLMTLSEFKAKKPFVVSQGKGLSSEIEYSDPLDFPDVQLRASVHLAEILDMFPPKKEELSGRDGRPIMVVIREFEEEPEDVKSNNKPKSKSTRK